MANSLTGSSPSVVSPDLLMEVLASGLLKIKAQARVLEWVAIAFKGLPRW